MTHKNGMRRRHQQGSYWRRGSGSWHPPVTLSARQLGALFRRGLSTVTALAMLCTVIPIADAQSVDPGEAQSGKLLWHTATGYEVATRINTDVTIDVSGIVARVSVKQQFRNDGREWSEGIYVFPLPDDAAIDSLRMQAGDRIIEGEIQEKARAKKTYDVARRAGKRTSLVSQQRSNLFTTSIANIAPGESVTIEIAYLQAVELDDSIFSLRFPMTLTPRYVPGYPAGDRQGSGWSPDTSQVDDASLITPPVVAKSSDHRVTLRANIDAGMPLEIIASRYHPVDIARDRGRYTVHLKSPDEVMDHDFELIWRAPSSSVPRVLSFSEVQESDRHVLLMLMPPTAANNKELLPPRDLTFVIDTSGSMHGVSLQQAKKAVLLALDGLRNGDQFNLIQFNSITESLYPHSVPATMATIQAAKAWVNKLKANGGTEMLPALSVALESPSSTGLRQLVFVTDGSVGNEEELFKLISTRLNDTRLFTVGIGSAPNGWFMRKAAELGRGSFVTISALHEVQEKMTKLVSRLREPVITDIELEWPDELTAISYPQKVADLYRGEPVIVKARLHEAPRDGDQLQVSGQGPGGPWSIEVPLSKTDAHIGVAALWARARVEAISDSARQAGNAEMTRAEITKTALRYGLISRYTSLVAVDKTPVRPPTDRISTEQVPNLLPYGQSQNAIMGFPATATSAPLMRLFGALLVLCATLLLFFRVCTVRGPDHALAD